MGEPEYEGNEETELSYESTNTFLTENRDTGSSEIFMDLISDTRNETTICNEGMCAVDVINDDGRSLSDKYEMMERFLKENRFEIIEKIDVYRSDFEIAFKNTIKVYGKKRKRFKGVIDVIRFFQQKGFVVLSCGYRKKVTSNYEKRSRLEAWYGEDYYWVQIDSYSKYFEKKDEKPEVCETCLIL